MVETRDSTEQRDLRERFEWIKAYYAIGTPCIMAEHPWRWALEPNEVDWASWFSPIEAAFWSEMRQEGAVLYPQYPVGGYFLDFAHPKVKVAVECDGAKWHMDRQKDWRRDDALRAQGWTVFRLTGRQCFESSEVEADDSGADVEELGRPALLLRALGQRFHITARYARQAGLIA